MSFPSPITAGKSAVGSVTLVSGAVIIVGQLAKLIWGYELTPDDQGALAGITTSVISMVVTGSTIVGGIAVIVRRFRPQVPITSVLPKS